MSKTGRQAEMVGILRLPEPDWHLRVYLMRGDPNEVVAHDCLMETLAAKVKALIANYLSDEFTYVRSGFIVAHFGRRGVTYSIWHWADWVGTWEYFCQAWYCYGRDLSSMEPLDRREPIVCHHEVGVVAAEADCFIGLVLSGLSYGELVSQYREACPSGALPDEFRGPKPDGSYTSHNVAPTSLR
jgi:hypothetical protein